MQEKRESTVANLVEALLKLPQHAIVEVGKEVSCMGGYATAIEYHPVDMEYGIEVFDFTDSDPLTHPKTAGKIFVQLEAI